MTVEPIVTAQWLKDNLNKVKVLDAAQTMKPKPDYKKFKTDYYGKFDKLIAEFKNKEYYDSHIPGAAHFNFDIGYYPSEFIKFDLYPPEVFGEYTSRLGISNDDHVVILGRGPAHGVLFASRVAWTLKAYGFNSVSIVNGGLEAWKAVDGYLDDGDESFTKGDFVPKTIDTDILAKFEDIPFNNFEKNGIVYLDVRSEAQFKGDEPMSKVFPNTEAKGAHVSGAKSFPMDKLVGPGGFKQYEEIDALINAIGLKSSDKVIIACNGGVQASVVWLALSRRGIIGKVYNGSMTELAYRAPELVNSN